MHGVSVRLLGGGLLALAAAPASASMFSGEALDKVAGAALEEREEILREAVADNARALEFANARYRVGAGDLRAVQQQALAPHAARTGLLRVQAERLVQRVNLHLALGGSFEAKQ